jgi:hypothetical protein
VVVLNVMTVMMLAAADGATGMATGTSIAVAIGMTGAAGAMAVLRHIRVSVLEVLGSVALMVEAGGCSRQTWRLPSTTASAGRMLVGVGTTARGTVGTAMAAEPAATAANATTGRAAPTMVRSLAAGTTSIFAVPVMILAVAVVTKSPS